MTDDNIEALETKAVELLQGQKWAEALAVLEELARAKPLSATMLHNKAVCHAMLKQFHQARWDLRQVLRQKPGYERAVVLLKEVQREIARMPPGLSQREEARVRAAAAREGAKAPQGPKAGDRPKAEGQPEGGDDTTAAKAVVRFRCGQCGARLEETSALSGQQVPCPACGAPCDVPRRKPRGKVVLIVTSWSLAALVLIGIAAAILLNPDLLGPGKPGAPGGPASRPGPPKAGANTPPGRGAGVYKPATPARPATRPSTRPATRPAYVTPTTGPATKPAKTTRPATKPATTTRPASRPTSRPVATTQPASRPAATIEPTSRPAGTTQPASRPATTTPADSSSPT